MSSSRDQIKFHNSSVFYTNCFKWCFLSCQKFYLWITENAFLGKKKNVSWKTLQNCEK